MGALSLSCSPVMLLRCILRRPPPSTAATSFLKLLKHHPPSTCSISLPSPFPVTPRSFSTEQNLESDVDSVIGISSPAENENKNDNGNEDPRISSAHKEMMAKLKDMSVKEKKELGSYANSLGKKLKSQQVGKSGVTDSVATALIETLEANELLKLKIHNNCPGELDDVVSKLEESTGSVVVGRIGRTVIIYRPSLTKLKAEEKKKQNLKIFLKRRAAFKSSYQGSTQSRGGQSSAPSYQRSYHKSR